MSFRAQRPPTRRPRGRGFTLVVTLALMILMMVLAVALLGLAAFELRISSRVDHEARARANARLALMIALGELQRHAGADTRATAPASILGGNEIRHPNWTGVWNTRLPGGGAFLQRDDLSGGLRDLRASGWDRENEVLAWLVSGAETSARPGPRVAAPASAVELVGKGSVGAAAPSGERVSAPRIDLRGTAGRHGSYAWWVGDLGVKANVATRDAHESRPDSERFRRLLAQEADATILTDGDPLDADRKSRLASDSTSAAMGGTAADRRREHFHDFTTWSEGVLADMAEGGLKRDLTAYFESDGAIPDSGPLPGLRDDDRLVGPADPASAEEAGILWESTRHRSTAPRFGLLRRWATSQAPDAGPIEAVLPKPEPSPRVNTEESLALANHTPAAIASLDTPNLVPVMVEGSLKFSLSWFAKIPPPGSPAAGRPFEVRQHLYPRVVLWNPYNTRLTLDRSIVMIQGNGRQEIWMDGLRPQDDQLVPVRTQWIFFEGGRNPKLAQLGGIHETAYQDPYIGSFYFTVPRTTFEPGECLVFTAADAAEYNGSVIGSAGYAAIDSNLLSCEKPPHPSRNFYMSENNVNGGIDFMPTYYWFEPTVYWTQFTGRRGIENQGDDCRVILKHLGERRGVSFEDFDALPQIALVSGSMQFGGGREPRIAWNRNERMPLEQLSATAPLASLKPNVRTREGVRLRWLHEHLSNEANSGPLSGSPHFEEALLANWNPRAAYATRSPWDNVAGSLPATGSGGGPWFFGAYTRDLYDEAVDWDAQMPVPRGGRWHGNPFGPPQESGGRPIVLFDVPRAGTGVVSIGQLQHAKLSEFIWHPSYAVGQSLADPRLAAGLDRTAPPLASAEDANTGGFSAEAIGWSSDSQRSANEDAWARQARAIYQDYPETENLVYDLSFEVNRSLWDAFFLSTGDRAAKEAFVADPASHPLPNGRLRRAPGTGGADDLADFHRAACHLTMDGSFNVNSTSIEAWEAVLGGTRRVSGGRAAFPRALDAPGGEWAAGQSADSQAAWSGSRTLTDEEVDRLAVAIVAEVKTRGPFLSLADFVNRRLADDETGRMGALQAAIEAADVNDAFVAAAPLDNTSPLPDYSHPDNIRDATRLDQTLKPASKLWGLPGYLTQGDLLQALGPVLNARSDTFVIRAYGDSRDAAGRIQASAWCEAVVQRTPEPLEPDETGLNSARQGKPGDFGRRFIVKSRRWLASEEV